jgi:hypothetical protein
MIVLQYLVAFSVSVSAAQIKSGADGKTSRDYTPGENPALVEHFQDAFESGFVVGPKRLQEAQKSLTQARRLAPRDPRVDYALGLVQVKQTQIKQAVTQFQAAIAVDHDYWPAWQGAIWGQFVDKRYEPGFKQLIEFSKLVRQAAPADETSEMQRDAARWIGQVLAALTLADDAKRNEKLLGAQVDNVVDALGEELWEALEEGRNSLTDRELARGQAEGLARQASEKTDKVRRARKAADLDKTIEETAKAKEDNEKSKDDWKTWLEEGLAKSDKELARLEKDYAFLNQRAQSLDQSITLAGQELTAMQLTISMINPRTANPMAMQNSQQQYIQRQNQLTAYQLDYNATVGRMNDVAQAGSVAYGRRTEMIARYEKATGDLVKKNASLDKWGDRLKNEKKKLDVNKPAKNPKGGANDKQVDKKPVLPSFKTILPLDLQHEKERVMTSLSPPPKLDETESKTDDQ